MSRAPPPEPSPAPPDPGPEENTGARVQRAVRQELSGVRQELSDFEETIVAAVRGGKRTKSMLMALGGVVALITLILGLRYDYVTSAEKAGTAATAKLEEKVDRHITDDQVAKARAERQVYEVQLDVRALYRSNLHNAKEARLERTPPPPSPPPSPSPKGDAGP